jgi:hypothetical protein
MFQLANETPFAAERSVQLDPDGVQHWVVVVKATYELDATGQPKLAGSQEPVCLAPRYLGKEGRSSLLREAEMIYTHPGTDVLLNATAHAPRGRTVRQMDVTVTVGPLRKSLRVFGDRAWVDVPGGIAMSPPVAFEKMPLTYERAFGGAGEPRNPIGTGHARSAQDLTNVLLPNIEDPSTPIRAWNDSPAPCGLGAITSHWAPRAALAGTHDEAWKRTKLPLHPDDFDPRFFVCAPVGLHSPASFLGGERVHLDGLSPDGPLSFSIPREAITVDTRFSDEKVRQEVQIDRVILEPDERRVIVVRRSSLPAGLRFRDIKRSVVKFKPRVPR